MKKILSALGIIVICLCSCNNNITNPEVDEQKNETKTETPNTNSTLDNEKSNCLLNIGVYYREEAEYLVLNSLTIKDENGKVVGSGNYWGSYYVPYDGTLTIKWKHRNRDTDFVTSEYTFKVKSAHQLDFVMYNTYDDCRIIVGADILYGVVGAAGIADAYVIASFDH